MQPAKALVRRDDVRETDAELVVDHHDFALRDETSVHQHIQGLPGESIQFHHGPLRQLLDLRPGDVIAVDLPEVLVAEVDGVPVLEGGYGVVNGQYALKVERLVGGERDGGH